MTGWSRYSSAAGSVSRVRRDGDFCSGGNQLSPRSSFAGWEPKAGRLAAMRSDDLNQHVGSDPASQRSKVQECADAPMRASMERQTSHLPREGLTTRHLSPTMLP